METPHRMLIVGYGDIARRVAARLPARTAVRSISRSQGADLDQPTTLHAFTGGTEEVVLHTAPPPTTGLADTRTTHLLALLSAAAILPRRVVYISTSGVYGDCAGAWVDETAPLHPQTPRAVRRVDAEAQLTEWCLQYRVQLTILRAPGIYALSRLPLVRLLQGTPVLREADDVYTNHIHADDLATICLHAMQLQTRPGIYNASDDSTLKMGAYMARVAERFGLPLPPQISRDLAATRIAAPLLSFMRESRRLKNTRLKHDLGIELRYPAVEDFLAQLEPHAIQAALTQARLQLAALAQGSIDA
jgi:nucleoside-diphosphate-sugar epimerase